MASPHAYCFKCKATEPIQRPKHSVSSNGRALVKGTCPHGHPVCRIVGLATTAGSGITTYPTASKVKNVGAGSGITTYPTASKVKNVGAAIGGRLPRAPAPVPPDNYLPAPAPAQMRKGKGFGFGRGLTAV